MDEMVERVAKAVLDDLENRRGIQQELEGIKDTDPEVYDEIKDAIGRAAIAAMREPTERMKLAGARSIGKSMREANHLVRSLKCWQVMASIALDDEQPLPPLPENKGLK